jgi:hypothetical protein
MTIQLGQIAPDFEGIYVLPTARRKGVAGAPRKRPEAALDFLVVGVSAGTQYQSERN